MDVQDLVGSVIRVHPEVMEVIHKFGSHRAAGLTLERTLS